eukprot:gnl/Dysnectes_brevis/6001_a8993_295.p1 GENE.gnl/Dysnectes_brevis/6001_a8993_295~~gnl/Dysnectes_brevis/6001_a8993_295.p1  ORF type:complete len:535 (-),score=100.13 gnl/Dysnectes_brevis/6001_a8993_295:551-2092(-)
MVAACLFQIEPKGGVSLLIGLYYECDHDYTILEKYCDTAKTECVLKMANNEVIHKIIPSLSQFASFLRSEDHAIIVIGSKYFDEEVLRPMLDFRYEFWREEMPEEVAELEKLALDQQKEDKDKDKDNEPAQPTEEVEEEPIEVIEVEDVVAVDEEEPVNTESKPSQPPSKPSASASASASRSRSSRLASMRQRMSSQASQESPPRATLIPGEQVLSSGKMEGLIIPGIKTMDDWKDFIANISKYDAYLINNPLAGNTDLSAVTLEQMIVELPPHKPVKRRRSTQDDDDDEGWHTKAKPPPLKKTKKTKTKLKTKAKKPTTSKKSVSPSPSPSPTIGEDLHEDSMTSNVPTPEESVDEPQEPQQLNEARRTRLLSFLRARPDDLSISGSQTYFLRWSQAELRLREAGFRGALSKLDDCDIARALGAMLEWLSLSMLREMISKKKGQASITNLLAEIVRAASHVIPGSDFRTLFRDLHIKGDGTRVMGRKGLYRKIREKAKFDEDYLGCKGWYAL